MRLVLRGLAAGSLAIASLASGARAQPIASAQADTAAASRQGDVGSIHSALNGRPICDVLVNVREIFDEDAIGSFYRSVNAIKFNTKEHVVLRELLFEPGDRYDEFLVRESERNLRNQRFLRNVRITSEPSGDCVNILVSVQDTWTLIPQVNYSSGTGKNRRSAGLAESNLLGFGKRFEALYDEDENRQSVDLVYDDQRFLGTKDQLIAAVFNRSDGNRYFLQTGRPFRSLVEDNAWQFKLDDSDQVSRLFEASDESAIFRQDVTNVEAFYTISRGNPETLRKRLSFGYAYLEESFTQADADDFEDLDLDPAEVDAPVRITDDRRFSGPTLTYRSIEPKFVSMNYIDRFDRIEDYNLGREYSTQSQIAPEELGSDENRLLFSGLISEGKSFSRGSFLRGEAGFGTRMEETGLDNTIFTAELKYFDVLTPIPTGTLFLGRHTLAAALTVDYALDLDENRQIVLGGDNGLRGYEARTFTGDKRIILNVEDRVHFVDDAFKLLSVGAAVFFDAGGATYESPGNLLEDEMYADIGAGLRFAFPRSSGGRVFRVDLALPLRDGPDGSNAFEPRVIFAGGQLFGARTRSESSASVQSTIAAGLGDN